MNSIITLTTDFEEREPYVASAKGVIYARCPEATIVDLTHQIRRQGVAEAALFLAGSLPYFPQRTVHLVAVASGARPIAVSMGSQFVVCPDNGVLTLLAEQMPVTEIRAITNPRLDISIGEQRYYARDVFAPAAAEIARNGTLLEIGERLDNIVRLSLPRAERRGDSQVSGQVIHVNRFGSLVTNIHRALIGSSAVSKVVAGDFPVGPLSNSYADVAPGKPLALFGSSGYLEIAYNGDSADKRLNLREGITVTVDLGRATKA
jgi:S-adenosylmethionine hydrolase